MAVTKTSFKKGEAKGRPKGVVNKATKDIKEAYKNLIELNLEQMSEWMQRVGEQNPAKAIELMANLSEYVIPKLSRTDSNVQIIDKTNTVEALKAYREKLLKDAE